MEIKDYSGKYNEITRYLMESFAKAKKGENIVISPTSIIMLLGIAADAVQGDVYKRQAVYQRGRSRGNPHYL